MLARRVALLLAMALPWAGAAHAQPAMRLMGMDPVPNQVVSGSGTAFALRFDHPVDHNASRFMLVANGAARSIPVRLGAQPNVLYGSVGQLPPGAYVLDWSARGTNGAVLQGSVPFRVGASP